jgi:hypothetical protein
MLPGDSRSDVDTGTIDDPRATQLWDGDHVIGRWLADHRTGDLERGGGVVWDAFLGFSPSARWRAQPTGLLTAGSTIIDNTDALERDFLPLLRGP